jgi:hypothetical protein
MHYSLSELPENDYRPRLADDRLGYFLTVVKDFSRDSADTFFVRYISRWKLEKQDPTAAVSPPKEPIVFYLDHTIPDQYRPYIREGTLMWNKAFRAAGFEGAIVVEDAPEDPDFDPEDARYNTIRWITSTQPSFGAIGPSRKDPRTGQILDADILIEAAMVQNVRRGYRNYVNTLEEPAASPTWRSHAGPAEWLCDLASGMELSAAVDAAFLRIAGEVEPGGEVPEEYLGQFLHWVTAHEVGHTLGLRHNFRASKSTPHDRLNDLVWTREHGLYNSVMEYPASNISLDRPAQGDYYSQTVGDYDIWAIRYGYTETGARGPAEELEALRKIAEESTRPGHEYGTDDDAFAGPVPIGVDPDVNHFDLGSDPLAFARDRLALIQKVRGRLLERGTADGESYERLRNTFGSLVAAQSRVLQIVAKQIGGLWTSRSHRGDPGERPSFTPVPASRQREAMSILVESGFSDDAWAVSAETINALQPNHWLHWGRNMRATQRLDYPYTLRVLQVQRELLKRLFHPILLARIQEVEARTAPTDAYTLAGHVRSLTETAFSGLGAGSSDGGSTGFTLTTLQRNLGRATLDHLTTLMNSPADGTPDDAGALARMNLVSLEKRMGKILAGRASGMDETTRAYLEDVRVRISRALDASSVLMAESGAED